MRLRQVPAAQIVMSGVPAPPGLAYYPFQIEGIRYALGRRATLIGDEMGCGKTVQALGLVNASPEIENVLVVCPAHLKLTWKLKSREWLTRDFRISIPDLDGYSVSSNFVITNHERIAGKRGEKLRRALNARTWDLLIVDECHYLKSAKAQRTVATLGKGGRGGLAARASRVLLLSGTPMENRPRELWTLLEVIGQGKFGSWYGYRRRYCAAFEQHIWTKRRNPGTKRLEAVRVKIFNDRGASNLEELHRKLRETCMIRRLKRDVLRELPEKVHELLVVPATSRAQKAALKKERQTLERIERLEEPDAVAFAETSRVRHETALSKLDVVTEHLRGMLEEGVEKVVAFSYHRDVASRIAEALPEAGPLLATGDTSVSSRHETAETFQRDPSRRILVATIGAMGTGHTLTAASHVVFAEESWVPAEISQAADRCHRIGQKDTVFVTHIVLDGSIDALVAKRLIEKQKVAEGVLDGKF